LKTKKKELKILEEELIKNQKSIEESKVLINKNNLDPLIFLTIALEFKLPAPPSKEISCNIGSTNWENGLFYYLGMMNSDDKKTWKSPLNRYVIITPSSDNNNNSTTYPLAKIIATPSNGTMFATKDAADSWIQFTLTRPIQINVTHYAIKGRGDYDGWHLRNWKLEGSIDGKNWSLLSTHSNDTLVKQNGIAKWKINIYSPQNNFFSELRIRQSGLNSSGSHHLIFQSIEFFGVIKGLSI